MGNEEFTEIREFGTGLRAYLEFHGVRLDARLHVPSNADLFELVATSGLPPEPRLMALQPIALAA